MAATNPDSLGYRGQRCHKDKMKTIVVQGIAFTVNAIQAPLWKLFLEEFHKTVEPLTLKGWDGSYACRPVRGSNVPSWHSWGCACDINASRHPLGHANTFSSTQRKRINALCKKYGLVWGGNFIHRKDEMHFEMHLTPAQVKAKLAALKKPAKKATPARLTNPYKQPGAKVILRRGDTGPGVRFVQWALFGPGKMVDGDFGNDTFHELRGWQTRHGLTPDGVAGPKTNAALAKVVH